LGESVITGGCFCGAVRYETAMSAFHETICHCADCRRAVGAHVVAWFSVSRSALALTGEPVRYRSSAGATRSFCGRCGTSLLFESDAHPDEVDVTLSTLDDPNALPPKDHTWTASKVGWDAVCDGLPAFARGRSAR
jgi:hypothetical protein